MGVRSVYTSASLWAHIVSFGCVPPKPSVELRGKKLCQEIFVPLSLGLSRVFLRRLLL